MIRRPQILPSKLQAFKRKESALDCKKSEKSDSHPKCKDPESIRAALKCDNNEVKRNLPSLKRRAVKRVFMPTALDSRKIDHVREIIETNMIAAKTMRRMLRMADYTD